MQTQNRANPWQDGLGRVAFGKRKDGKFAASVGGVVISIPRQVGKTYLLSGLVFALCATRPKTLVIWTASSSSTSTVAPS